MQDHTNPLQPTGPGSPYDGTFREDWEYVEGLGDLDRCIGRFGVAPVYLYWRLSLYTTVRVWNAGWVVSGAEVN